MRTHSRILIFTHVNHTARRQIVNGIGRYARMRQHWRPLIRWDDVDDWSVAKNLDACGVIAFPSSRGEMDALLRIKIPVVCVGPHLTEIDLPRIDWDNRAAGRLAVEHLIERGLNRIAFIGADFKAPYVAGRYEGAREAAVLHALEFSAFDLEPQGHQSGRETQLVKRASQWLRALEPPFGVVAATDHTGLDVLDALSMAGITVPEEAAVISVGGDNVLCPFSDPALSSVVLPGEQVGYKAAYLLDCLIAKKAEDPTAKIPPTEVQTRLSSEMIATKDEEVRQALRFIHDHADSPIQVDDVVATVSLSRRPLEIRFKRATGRTLQKEILRVRLERAKKLLIETDLPIADIAPNCGFTDPQRLTEAFSRELKIAPGGYRKSKRISDKPL